MDKKPGRPRKYETAAEKVDAFRQRLQSAGYLRKEVLVTQSTWEQVQALAQSQGVGVVDVASGLLEHGLRSYIGTQVLAGAQAQATGEPLLGAQHQVPFGANASLSPAVSLLTSGACAAQNVAGLLADSELTEGVRSVGARQAPALQALRALHPSQTSSAQGAKGSAQRAGRAPDLASVARDASSVNGDTSANPILNFFARRKEQL